VKKRLIFALLAIIIIGGMLAAGCSTTTSTTTPNPPTSATSSAPPTTMTSKPPTTSTSAPPPTSTTKPAGPVVPPTGEFANGVYGGTLRVISPAGPQVLGGFRGGPSDVGATFWGLSALMDATADRTQGSGLEPVLCSSVDDDIANKRIVFHLRQGVLFHDGTEMTSDVVRWNYQQFIDNGRLQYFNYFDHMDNPDKYTFIIYYNEYTNQLIKSWGWMYPRSEVAFEAGTGGSTDPEVQNAWDSTHIVAAGPFKLEEYVRDSHMYWDKFQQWWNAPLPYLDRVEIQFIPDPVTAKAMMEAGQGDYWGGATIQDQLDLVKKGFKRITGWVGLIYDIWPNTSSPTSIWNDLRLREAIDYAIDKDKIAKALGGGYWVAMHQMAPPTEWGYDPTWPGRPYNPTMAKQLLADAGYPNGLKTTMLVNSTSTDDVNLATAIKQYLDAVGIQTDLDLADVGRFMGTVWGFMGTPPENLSLMWSGMDTTYLDTYMRWFSSDMFANLAYLGRTDEQRALDAEAKAAPDAASQKAEALKVYGFMNTQARILPILQIPSAAIAAPYVHSQQFQQGFVRWQIELIYMDKH
jgi:ABC-type transport system substrate-binding protein